MYVMKLLTSKMVWTLAHATIGINPQNLLSERSLAQEAQVCDSIMTCLRF